MVITYTGSGRGRSSTAARSWAWKGPDEGAVRVRDALTPGGNISYTYDLGTCWEHEITLEQTFPADRGQDYPICVACKGDSPGEYWSEDDPEEANRST